MGLANVASKYPSQPQLDIGLVGQRPISANTGSKPNSARSGTGNSARRPTSGFGSGPPSSDLKRRGSGLGTGLVGGQRAGAGAAVQEASASVKAVQSVERPAGRDTIRLSYGMQLPGI